MNLHGYLTARAEDDRPVRVGLIGAGKFGAMFLAQARRTPGIHVLAIADLDVERARSTLAVTGWDEERYGAPDIASALSSGRTHVGQDAGRLIAADGLDIVIATFFISKFINPFNQILILITHHPKMNSNMHDKYFWLHAKRL